MGDARTPTTTDQIKALLTRIETLERTVAYQQRLLDALTDGRANTIFREHQEGMDLLRKYDGRVAGDLKPTD